MRFEAYLGTGQAVQQVVLQFFHLFLVRLNVLEELDSLVFQLSLLRVDDPAQQLVFQTFHCDSEVDDGCLGRDFGSVEWIAQFGGDVELEAFHHVDFFVANFDFVGGAHFDEILLEHVVQRRVKLFANVFQQKGTAQ